MKQVFVDTGAWYVLIDRNDPDHRNVVSQLLEYEGRLLTSNFAVDETLALLRFRLNWDVAHTFGVKIREELMCQVARITPADEDAAWKIFESYRDKSFSFTDCTSFAIMSRMKIETAIAIDNDFRAYGLHCLP